jgi:hypothetical protein
MIQGYSVNWLGASYVTELDSRQAKVYLFFLIFRPAPKATQFPLRDKPV